MQEQVQNIILFDGVCNLCSGFVQFVIKRDKQAVFKFASLQSNVAQNLLQQHQYSKKAVSSVVLITNNQLYDSSTAVLRICKLLGGFWKILFGFIIIPAFVRDFVYRIVAKQRYKWFGKKEICWVPNADLQKRFL